VETSGPENRVLERAQVATTKHQAKELAVDFCLNGRRDKLKGLKELIKMSQNARRTDCLRRRRFTRFARDSVCGFSAAVANAVDEIKRAADYVTRQKGGEGAVREIIETYSQKNRQMGRPCEKIYGPSVCPLGAKVVAQNKAPAGQRDDFEKE